MSTRVGATIHDSCQGGELILQLVHRRHHRGSAVDPQLKRGDLGKGSSGKDDDLQLDVRQLGAELAWDAGRHPGRVVLSSQGWQLVRRHAVAGSQTAV